MIINTKRSIAYITQGLRQYKKGSQTEAPLKLSKINYVSPYPIFISIEFILAITPVIIRLMSDVLAASGSRS